MNVTRWFNQALSSRRRQIRPPTLKIGPSRWLVRGDISVMLSFNNVGADTKLAYFSERYPGELAWKTPTRNQLFDSLPRIRSVLAPLRIPWDFSCESSSYPQIWSLFRPVCGGLLLWFESHSKRAINGRKTRPHVKRFQSSWNRHPASCTTISRGD